MNGVDALMGDDGGWPYGFAFRIEGAVEDGSGRFEASYCRRDMAADDMESLSSSRSLFIFSPRAVTPSASSSVLRFDCDLMKEPRSSRMGWYLVSGFLDTIA